jgi:deoxyribonuclease IV
MRFGMHLSFSTGPGSAKEIGANALQIFCGNPRGWEKRPLDAAFVARYREDLKTHAIAPLVVHATYLINLAAPDDHIYRQSCESFAIELQRSAQLGAAFYVIHIGNHKGSGFEAGRERVGFAVKHAFKNVADAPTVLFENTSGSGTTLGTTFEDVAAVLNACGDNRVGLCLDTCHALAAGYDMRTPAGVKQMLDSVEKTVGLQRFHCIHLNDSKGELGSKLDRHEHIGEGQIGLDGFRAFFADKRVHGLPVILETPQDEPSDRVRDLWTAFDLAEKAGAATAKDIGQRPAPAVAASAKPTALNKPGAAAKKSSVNKAPPKKALVKKVPVKKAKAAAPKSAGRKAAKPAAPAGATRRKK